MEIEVNKKDILSKSYTESIERVAKQKNNEEYSFQLPKEVLEERETVWDNFFQKYNNEVPNAVELDIDTLAPVGSVIKPTADDDDDDGDDGEEEDDDENEEHVEDEEGDDEDKEYYSKCRAPLRKIPALIQYWIDTGNPPYQLVGDDDNSETGSSLSEGSHSRTGHSAILRDSSEQQKKSSHCSSVDTAAYILSNTNTTKKSDTLAILAKSTIDKTSKLQKLTDNTLENVKNSFNISQNCDINFTDNVNISKSPKKLEKTELKNNHKNLEISSKPEISSPSQQSVKLSLIIPELKEFDESSENSSSSISLIHKKSRNVKVFGNAPNRRRLFTGRDSPIDLVETKHNDGNIRYLRRSLHPALEMKINNVKNISRVRGRKKRKRAIIITTDNDDNTSQESVNNIEKKSNDDSRYKDFFESLGLTPSRMIDCKIKRNKVKRQRIVLPREAKNIEPVDDSIVSTNEETGSQKSDFSPSKMTNINDNIVNNVKICSLKIPKLSDEILAKYGYKSETGNTINDNTNNFTMIFNNSSSDDSEKKEKRGFLDNIELLNSATQDSDSSTILICSCDPRSNKVIKKTKEIREKNNITENNDNSIDNNRLNSPRVTIGSRIFVNSKDNYKQIINDIPLTRSRCNLGISFDNDEDEDSFSKFVADIKWKNDERDENIKNPDKIDGLEFKKHAKNEKKSKGIVNNDEKRVKINENHEKTENIDNINESKPEKFENNKSTKLKNFKTKIQNDVRRSMRQKLSVSSIAKNKNKTKKQKTLKNSISKNDNITKVTISKDQNKISLTKNNKISKISSPNNVNTSKNSLTNKETKNIFADTNSPDTSIFLHWEDSNLTEKQDDKINLKFIDKSSKPERRILRNTLSFKTRIDEDSDEEFEGLRFSLNEKYFKNQKISTNSLDDSNTNETKRTSPRRSVINTTIKSQQIDEQKRGRNLFNDKTKKQHNENFWNYSNNNNNDDNENLVLEFDETKTFNEKQKKKKNKIIHKSRNLRKFDESKNQSSIVKKRNGDDVNLRKISPQAKKLKYQRNGEYKNEWETEDEESNENKIDFSKSNMTNGDFSKKRKNLTLDTETLKKSQEFTRNLFSQSPDDNIVDVDLLFGTITKSPDKNDIINGLKFTTRKYKNLSNSALRMNFRTRLRSDTEDDGDL